MLVSSVFNILRSHGGRSRSHLLSVASVIVVRADRRRKRIVPGRHEFGSTIYPFHVRSQGKKGDVVSTPDLPGFTRQRCDVVALRVHTHDFSNV